jgi:hypothetical protein
MKFRNIQYALMISALFGVILLLVGNLILFVS